ncbi:MAG TPA: fumarylacetoacetate hydrolase family protein [Chloroflexota bacterium]|nr:fumarylacetoacetate hydrolase family protein [Chloroflexota bacterium]
MKLVTIAAEGRERLGVLTDAGIVDLAAAAEASERGNPALVAEILAFLGAGAAARELAATLVDWALPRGDAAFLRGTSEVQLLAPVPRPPKILCLAGNYAEHWREGGHEAPPKQNHTPEVFVKPVTTIVGPDAPIVLPGAICTAVDYEGELAVVIGQRARNVAAEHALSYVAGYANFNDISGRRLTVDVNRNPTARTNWFDWLNGKWFDTFGPLGPFVAVDEVADPRALAIQTRVNGEVRQKATTGDMIFTVAETIAWISGFLTLQPGDIIATGTPSGVGATTQTFLKAGDVVEVEVSGLGVLRNRVREALD